MISKPAAADSTMKPPSSHPCKPHVRRARAGSIARWTLAVLACLWLALCTAVGPLYWSTSSLADWAWSNTAFFMLAFIVYLGMIVALARWAANKTVIPPVITKRRHRTRTTAASADNGNAQRIASHSRTSNGSSPNDSNPDNGSNGSERTHTARIHEIRATLGRWMIHGTNRTWNIALILFLGWLWVPSTLLAAFGADLRSQIREFSWAWNQWTGLKQPYIGFFSFVPMDIYPTAHYMWPGSPTYLTDQHNVVLTVIYGAVAMLSRTLTGSNDAGIVVLAALQMLFAVFCCASAMNRFCNLPWLQSARRVAETAKIDGGPSNDSARASATQPAINTAGAATPAGALSRFLILLLFLFCPLVVFATISITKSPLFAFAFVWWFSIWYELRYTWTPAPQRQPRFRRAAQPLSQQSTTPQQAINLPAHSIIAFIIATSIMLISAKYAWYIIALQIILALISDRRRWATYVVALLIPTMLIHGGIALAIASGRIIGGDPIESRGVQLQMIARVAKYHPEGISQEARNNLEPVFNLDQMAEAYSQQDADPVKSSGIQSKKVSYKWRTVTPEDMKNFNKAWLEIVRDNPVIAIDALLAKCFGYFDVADHPYVAMDYYVNSDYVQKHSTWIKNYNHDWRNAVATFADEWGYIPVLGWPTHGNFYVILTLIIGAVEVIRRRWLTLVMHMPLLLLMGVMVTAPANNFERHMLPVAFVFGFLVLTFWRESQAERHAVSTTADPS